MPAGCRLHDVPEFVSGGPQFLNSIIVRAASTVRIRFLFDNFDGQINIAHLFDLPVKHAAKKTTLVTLPKKYGSRLARSTRRQNSCNAFSAVAGVTRLAAAADD
jgi:hypothetical protein